MVSEGFFRAFTRIQYTAKVVVPILLSLDLCHNVVVVNRLWKERLRGWREEDERRVRAQITAVCQRMAVKCHTEHKSLWPAGLGAHLLLPADPALNEDPSLLNDSSTREDDFLESLGLLYRDVSASPGAEAQATISTDMGSTLGPEEGITSESVTRPTEQQITWQTLQDLLQSLRMHWREGLRELKWPAAWQLDQPWPTVHWEVPDAVRCKAEECLQAVPLPKITGSRASALRFKIHSFEWALLTRLLTPQPLMPLELQLED